MKCAHGKCPNTFEAHRWAKVRAQTLGWFMQRNGKAWCPDHVPGWVVEWRKNKQRDDSAES